MTPALAVHGLTVRYGGFTALSDFEIEVPRGMIAGLIGPNGAGKTTCFNAICGYVRAEGAVEVFGSPLKLGDSARAWRAGLARTFQRLELFLTLTVREHVELARREAARIGRSPASVDEVLDITGLRPDAQSMAATLPLGRARVLELARALATGGEILMLDESASGLDRDETEAFADVVRDVQAARGATVLLIEHDMEFVRSLATQISVLDFGRLVLTASTAEVLADERVREVYLGTNEDAA